MTRKAKTPQNTTGIGPVVVIFCVTVIYIVTGYMTLDEDSRHVPILTGYVTIFLLLLETLKRYMPGLFGIEPETKKTVDEEAVDVSISRELTGLLYVAGLALTVFLFGFFIAIPVYLFVAITVLGKQPVKTATIVTITASIIIYLVFELLLEMRMYQGLLFS